MTEVPLTTTEISEQVKRRAKPVNQGYSLDAYFAVADSTGVTAKIYRDEGNQQELFRVLMAFCTLVVETMGKHRDHAGDKHKVRYRAYLAEVKACMEEMEAIKPGINAEAKVYRERMHAEEPKARPPPVAGAGTAAGVASSITRPHGWNSTSDSQPSTSGTMSNGGTIDDLLSASPEELAAAAAASLGTLTLDNRDDTAVRQSQSEDGLHRYRPKSEFAAAATSTSTARHSLLGTSLPPQPKPQTHIPQIRDVTPISTSSQAGNYPSVRSTKTAVPEMRANLSTPPPPPQGPPPQTPSAPPMPMPMPPHASTNTAVTGVTVPRGQPPPPPGPPPSGVPTGNYGLSAASRELLPKRIQNFPEPSYASKDHDRLDNRLAAYGLKEKKVRGDGNCQFRALADQLFGDQERHAECRAVCMNQLRAESEHYRVFVPEDWGSYVSEMSRDAAWGDHITLQAASDAYGVGMCVISSYKDNFVIEISPRVKRSERVLWISFWAEVHYNSIYTADAAV